MAHMTGLRNKVDWSTAVFTWDGPDDIIRFCQHNQTLFETVLKAVFSDSPPTGSGSTSAEITHHTLDLDRSINLQNRSISSCVPA